MAVNNKVIEYGKGQKLFVTLSDNRSLEGSFSRSSSARKSIVLHNVSFVPDNGKCFEQLELKFDEILQIDSLGNTTEDQPISPVGSEVPLKKQDGALYQKLKENVENHIFINQVDEKFSEAMKILERADSMAVTGQGSDQGRFGYLSILGVATNNSVFLFDVVNLGERVFKSHGSFLKKILETNKVLKVVHNCCLLSDCLKHKYNVTLKNVFDTQACHVIIVKNSGHPPIASSFANIIKEYLQLPNGICEQEVPTSDVWRRRPLEAGMVKTVAWRVAVLQKLKPRMDDALYAPFDSLCQSYLSQVRDLDDEFHARIKVQQHQGDRLPEEFDQ